MGVTLNGFGRQLGLLRKIYQACHKFLAGMAYHLNMLAFGPAGGVVGLAVFSLWYRAFDWLLEAEIILNADFEELGNGAPSMSSIGDILSYANYYFPLDTLGHLAGLYVGLWSCVATLKYAQKMTKMITDFKSAIKA